jgi:methyltransferase (TIGR00027 family)
LQEKRPSRTAFGAAAHRAMHQVIEKGRIFTDPLAARILTSARTAVVGKLVSLGFTVAALALKVSAPRDTGRGLRLFIAARSRVAEDALAMGVKSRGVRQLVVLGAGLDTFAYRNPFPDRLRVFEVDHPATQAWKRRRLAAAGIAIPASLTFAPVNFESEDVFEALRAAGVDPGQRSFFMWLGVVPYLTRTAIGESLAIMGGLPGGAEVVFDYSDPPETLSVAARASREDRARRVAAVGEPFVTTFEPAELHGHLRAAGFVHLEDKGPHALSREYYRAGSAVSGPDRGGHILFAATAWPEV